MPAAYCWLGLGMAVIGAVITALALAQRIFSFALFESNPMLIGVVIGTVGATLMYQYRHQ